MGNVPENLNYGLDIGGSDMVTWANAKVDISSNNILIDSSNTSSFIYDYVEVDPLQ